MKKMFLLFSHKLTEKQVEDARKSHYVDEFIYLPKPLQELWSNVPPEIGPNALSEYAEPFKKFLEEKARPGDMALVSGDFGLTYIMVEFCYSQGIKPVYATTRREVVEEVGKDGQVTKKTIFKHVKFREF